MTVKPPTEIDQQKRQARAEEEREGEIVGPHPGASHPQVEYDRLPGIVALREGSDHGVVHGPGGDVDLMEDGLGVAEMAGGGYGGEGEEAGESVGVAVGAGDDHMGVGHLELGHVSEGGQRAG